MADTTQTVDSSTTTKTQAESSTATAVQQPTDVNQFTSEERHEWRKTGNWPERKAQTKPEDSSTSKDKSESAPASEAGKTTQEKPHDRRRSNAETRANELIREFGGETVVRELLDERKRRAAGPATEKPAASSPAAAPVEELKEPVMPEMKDFEGKPWSEYQAAIAKYTKDMAKFASDKAIQDFQQRQAAEQSGKIINAAMAEAQKAYPDWKEVGGVAMQAIYGDGKAESGAHPAVKHAIGMFPAEMPHLLYVLGGDKGLTDFVALSRRDPVAAIMEIGVKRALLSEELAKAGKEAADLGRNDKGQFVPNGKEKVSPDKKVSSAPPPAAEVSGKGSPPPDAALEAQKKGDFDAYRAEMNRRDLERRKGR